jgi:hypothetical protein
MGGTDPGLWAAPIPASLPHVRISLLRAACGRFQDASIAVVYRGNDIRALNLLPRARIS